MEGDEGCRDGSEGRGVGEFPRVLVAWGSPDSGLEAGFHDTGEQGGEP